MKGEVLMSELSDVIHNNIMDLCSLGDSLVEEGKYLEFVKSKLKEPKGGWNDKKGKKSW